MMLRVVTLSFPRQIIVSWNRREPYFSKAVAAVPRESEEERKEAVGFFAADLKLLKQ